MQDAKSFGSASGRAREGKHKTPKVLGLIRDGNRKEKGQGVCEPDIRDHVEWATAMTLRQPARPGPLADVLTQAAAYYLGIWHEQIILILLSSSVGGFLLRLFTSSFPSSLPDHAWCMPRIQ